MLGVKQATPTSVRLGLTQDWKLGAAPTYYNHNFFTQFNVATLFDYKNKPRQSKTSFAIRRNFIIMDTKAVMTSRLNLLVFYYPSTLWVAKMRMGLLKGDLYFEALEEYLELRPARELILARYSPFTYRSKITNAYFAIFAQELKNILKSLHYTPRMISIQFHNLILVFMKEFIEVAQYARKKYVFLSKLGSLNYLFIALYFLMRHVNLYHFSTLMTVWMHRRKTLRHFQTFNLYLNVLKIFWFTFTQYRFVHAVKFYAQGPIGRHGRSKAFKFTIGVMRLASYENYVSYHRSTITSPYGSLGFKFWAYSKLTPASMNYEKQLADAKRQREKMLMA